MTSGPRFSFNVRALVLAVAVGAGLADAQYAPRSATPPRRVRETVAPVGPGEAVARTESAFPTGNRATSMILLERMVPVEVRPGSGFNYELMLTNLTRSDIEDVQLTEQLPPTFRLASITPEPTRKGAGTVSWHYKVFPAGGRAVIRVTGSTERAEDLTWCAKVTFNTGFCSTTRVAEPKLMLAKVTPPTVTICEPIPVKLVVTNTGTGAVQDVQVVDRLPQGWRSTDGKDALAFNAGTLKPGESREFSFQVRSAGTGRFVNEATASEPGGQTARASSETVVRQPVLAVVKSGPEMRYIGRSAEYKITVTNTGDAPARDAVLVDTISGVGEFVNASDGGQFAGGRVSWSLGTLAPGASRTVGVTLVGRRAGTIRDDAVATAYCAEARASASTEVRGVAAILLEVVDVSDPIEEGAADTYVITVTNQGSANDTNIRVKCVLPAEEEFVSAEGPTQYQVQGKTVLFGPLPTLAPKATVVYRVVVKGTQAGDVRFRTTLNSDMLSVPVEESESTHVY